MDAPNYHRLLSRQIRRFLPYERIEGLEPFLQSISDFYKSAEQERKLLENTLDVSSKELEEANHSLKQQHEEMHNSILNALNIGLFAIDNEGQIIFANESAHYLFGLSHQKLVGCNITQFIHDQDISDIIEYGVGFGRREGESELFDIHETRIPIRYFAYPIFHESLPKGTVFSLTDISLDQKREELIDLQQLALESTATMMLIADNEGNIQYANKEFVLVSGYESEELIGEDSRYIINNTINDPEMVKTCWEHVKSGKVWEGEILAQSKDGNVYFEELTLTPLVERGRVTHFVAVKKDISERIRIQEELKFARDEAIMAMNQAKEANRAKDTFLSSMSHELRTPLNAINGFSQILLAKSDTPESAKKFIEKIYISGNNLLSLVNTILDFSKIEAGKMEVHYSPFMINELLKEVQILVESMAHKKNLILELVLNIDIILNADRQLIKQVLVNLLSNAIKFSPEGETVTLTYSVDETTHIFSIIDHGYGIPKDKIATLFDPFVQIREHQNESIKGSGLGLSIVKKIIELHHGTVWIESTEREGSRFYFSLPRTLKTKAANP
ncbi:MAG: PAS domain S-box protein [Sulfuricurvum sp.]|nr:PAS domain S-box protein [Sulfuricurvum sp.]MDD5386879.1 PAS domain S-box protein [Sulfuricurvum sp.]